MSGKGLHIVLVGFMGSGKSTIGKMLAQQLKRPFIDTDQEVERSEGMTIAQIFEQKGESYFRKAENDMLQSILKSKVPSVIATGGGAPCFLDGIEYILKYSYSFYLKVGRQTLLERVEGDKSRPLAVNKTKRELKQFIDVSLRKRETFYKKANRTIQSIDPPKELTARIIRYIDKEQI